jgi:hypothetical protein
MVVYRICHLLHIWYACNLNRKPIAEALIPLLGYARCNYCIKKFPTCRPPKSRKRRVGVACRNKMCSPVVEEELEQHVAEVIPYSSPISLKCVVTGSLKQARQSSARALALMVSSREGWTPGSGLLDPVTRPGWVELSRRNTCSPSNNAKMINQNVCLGRISGTQSPRN